MQGRGCRPLRVSARLSTHSAIQHMLWDAEFPDDLRHRATGLAGAWCPALQFTSGCPRTAKSARTVCLPRVSASPLGITRVTDCAKALGIASPDQARRPEIKGMVKCFNGRISDGLTTHRFDSALDLEQTLLRNVALDNHQLPVCLEEPHPIQSMKNWYILPRTCTIGVRMIAQDATPKQAVESRTSNRNICH